MHLHHSKLRAFSITWSISHKFDEGTKGQKLNCDYMSEMSKCNTNQSPPSQFHAISLCTLPSGSVAAKIQSRCHHMLVLFIGWWNYIRKMPYLEETLVLVLSYELCCVHIFQSVTFAHLTLALRALIKSSIISMGVWDLSMVVLYIGINKVWGFSPKNRPRNLPNIYFLTAWQHWLVRHSRAQNCLQINSKPLH